MTTLGGAVLDLRNLFRERGLSAPELAARELICARLGISKTELSANGGLYVSDETLEDVRQMARRHIGGEPLAYILGQWDFFGLTLAVTPDALIPRADTETLCGLAIQAVETSSPRVLDLCCGGGCVGLAIASRVPWADVTLADISPEAIRLAERNAVSVGAEARCMAADALAPPRKALGRFGVIVCNPPYISDAEYAELEPSVRDYEPELALRGGADGLTFYRAIARHWHHALEPGGTLLFEVGRGQAASVADILRSEGYLRVLAERDLAGIERVVIGHKNP